MPAGAVISLRDDGKRPKAEIMLANGDRVELALDRDGLTISHADGPLLFFGSPDFVARICAGLVSSTAGVTPLKVLAGLVVQLGSADQVRNVFSEAAEALAYHFAPSEYSSA
jgi:hypothetical protein